jgi:hypothetical protein
VCVKGPAKIDRIQFGGAGRYDLPGGPRAQQPYEKKNRQYTSILEKPSCENGMRYLLVSWPAGARGWGKEGKIKQKGGEEVYAQPKEYREKTICLSPVRAPKTEKYATGIVESKLKKMMVRMASRRPSWKTAMLSVPRENVEMVVLAAIHIVKLSMAFWRGY